MVWLYAQDPGTLSLGSGIKSGSNRNVIKSVFSEFNLLRDKSEQSCRHSELN